GPVLQKLLGRLHEARVMDQRLEDRVIGVHGEGGAHDVAGLLAHVLLAALGEHLGDGRLEKARLLGREVVGKEQVALFVEALELLGRELHGVPPSKDRWRGDQAAREITTFSRPVRMSAICSAWPRQSASASATCPASSARRMPSCSSHTLTRRSLS